MNTNVTIRETRYAALVEQSRATGVSVEELIDRALTHFIEYEQFISGLRMRMDLKAQAGK
jgi:hypothetical protein